MGRSPVISKLYSKILLRSAVLLICCVGLLLSSCAALPVGATTSDGVYHYRTVHNGGGIGKFYLGREIAQVMGHRAS
jgi:hypothetical protein